MSKNPCERKCWTCGNVAMHADDVAPDVCCAKCGSQDTRRTKPSAEDQAMTDRDEHAQIGALLERCWVFMALRNIHDGQWCVSVSLIGQKVSSPGHGTTQLSAIKAAVAAAEKAIT